MVLNCVLFLTPSLQVHLTVVRGPGNYGTTSVRWRAFQGPYDSYGIQQTDVLVFQVGEASKQIGLSVSQLAVTLNFTVQLSATVDMLAGAR